MPTYAAYLRVSSDEQKERATIQTQLEAINNYARANKIKLKHVFADDGVSGAIPVNNRTEGSRLIRLATEKTFDTLLVFRIDRISRDTLELLRTIKTLEQQGVVVRSITEPFETANSVGKFTLTLLGGMAQMERDAIRDRSGAGMRRGAQEGRWMGGRPPFGFQVIDGRLRVNEAEASVVREIFSAYLSHATTRQIADSLNARRVPIPTDWRRSSTGSVWRDSTVQKILRHSVYCGTFRWNKKRTVKEDGRRAGTQTTDGREQIAVEVEPIVSCGEFEAAQKRLRENLKFSSRNARREYILRGLVFCGDCGFACTGSGGQESPTYACNWRRAGVRCERPRVDAEELEASVWNDLVEIASEPESVLQALRLQKTAERDPSLSAEREQRLTTAIDGKTVERTKVLTLLRRDVISETEAEEQLRSIETERETLERERERLRDHLRTERNLEQSLTSLGAALKRIKRNAKRASPQERSGMIRAVVQKITLYETHVEIEYALPGP